LRHILFNYQQKKLSTLLCPLSGNSFVTFQPQFLLYILKVKSQELFFIFFKKVFSDIRKHLTSFKIEGQDTL